MSLSGTAAMSYGENSKVSLSIGWDFNMKNSTVSQLQE